MLKLCVSYVLLKHLKVYNKLKVWTCFIDTESV